MLGVFFSLFLYFGGAARYMQSAGSDPGLWALRGLGPGMILLGLLSTGGALIYGLHKAKTPSSGKGIQQTDAHTRVVGKFAFREGEMLTSDWQWEAYDDVEFYVKLQMSDQRIIEFRCAQETFDNCGDGLFGEAVYDGRWLGRFVAYVGGASMPRDPFVDKTPE
ncbi:MAG: hypothetical protein KF784_07715 [Fimbriimonadaceae bacterium]|nr:hypothetical protein [Fimbriimonadaceae bacterium]